MNAKYYEILERTTDGLKHRGYYIADPAALPEPDLIRPRYRFREIREVSLAEIRRYDLEKAS